MASDTTQVVRRKLAAPPATASTAQAEAPQQAVPATISTEEAAALPAEQVDKAKSEPDDLYYEETPSATEGLNTLRSNVHDSMRMLADLAKESWNLPLSRDTVYAMGEINGQYNLILAFINRDIADAQQT